MRYALCAAAALLLLVACEESDDAGTSTDPLELGGEQATDEADNAEDDPSADADNGATEPADEPTEEPTDSAPVTETLSPPPSPDTEVTEADPESVEGFDDAIEDVAAFDEVEVSGSVAVQIAIGDGPSATVTPAEAPVSVDSSDDTLRVSAEDDATLEDPVMVDVVTDDLEELDLQGDVVVYLANVEVDELEITIDGNGRVEGSGHVDELDIALDGDGEITLFDMTADDADIEIEGSGSVELTVTGDLDVDIEGDGTVTYQGDPTDIDIDGPEEQVTAG